MSRRVLLSGLLIGCLSGNVAAAVESQGTQQGWRALKEGDYARAERIFEQVLNQDPKDMKAWEGYRAAFSKRKLQEEGGGTPTPSEDSSSADSSSKPEPTEPPPKKPAKKRPVVTDDEGSGEASGDEGGGTSKKDLGRVDPGMLRNKKRAKERFETLREQLTQSYHRQHSGAVEIHCTYYEPQLYRHLIENLGAQKGYTPEKAQKLYEASVRDMRGQLEFYLKMTNYSSKPKLTVSIAEIWKKISLVDDEGNSYEPARWKAPKGTELVSDDAVTVWFNKTDSDGEDIVKKAAKGNLYLQISDLQHEQNQIQFQFKATRLSGETQGKASGSKSLMDRVKDLWK
jgi:hypothetical protein